jgi:hypothetical protein
MGFDVNLEDERGEILATISDPKNLLHRLLERAMEEEPRLAEIDWYGNTTFNRPQIPRFLSEWNAVARRARTTEDEAMVAEIKELAARCGGGVHLYLKFIGD